MKPAGNRLALRRAWLLRSRIAELVLHAGEVKGGSCLVVQHAVRRGVVKPTMIGLMEHAEGGFADASPPRLATQPR